MKKRIMRRIIFLLATVLLLSCGSLVYADTVASGTCGDNVTWKLSDDGIMVISGKGEIDDYVIGYESGMNNSPWYNQRESIEKIAIDNGVTGIGDAVFNNCVNLRSVEFSNGITNIGEYAFYNCTSLENVEIPNSVTSIGRCAFERCSNLESVMLPNGITEILYMTFGECSELKTIIIPDCVTTIENRAFDGCKNLEDVTIGKGVTYIGEAAFQCTGLSKLTVPGNVKKIENQAFKICTNLKEVTLESGITSIGERAFGNCKALENVSIPNSVTEMGPAVFEHCYDLKKVELGNGISKISDGLFNCCTSLEIITIPKNVKKIGAASFAKCISLIYLDLPETVDTISQFAFWECKNLQLIRLNSNNIHFGEMPFVDCSNLMIQCSSDANYLGELNKDNVSYSTTSCTIPTGHIIDVSQEAEEGFPISLSYLYELEYVDIRDSKYIDRISQENESVKKFYDDYYDILSGPVDKIAERLMAYSIKLDLGRNENAYILYVMDAVSSDYPELFWANNTGSWSREDGSLSQLTLNNYFDTWEELAAARESFDERVKMIVSETKGMSDYEKVCYFAEYFMYNCEYNHALAEGLIVSPSNFQNLCAHTAYGSIMGQKGETGPLCGGYAAGMKVLCDAANIPCTIVGGTLNGIPHGWNAIEINGVWYDWEPQHPYQESIIDHYEKELLSPTTAGFYKTDSSVHCESGAHLWLENYVVVKDATCMDNQVIRYTCETCGDYKTEYVEETKKDHVWALEYTIDEQASCKQTGSKSIHCTVCNCIKEGSSVELPIISHTWNMATCTTPKTCAVCGITQGSVQHDWQDATCEAPATYSRCGIAEGSSLGHDWQDATCEAPATCSRCGIAEGGSLGHDWQDATCEAPATCSRCGIADGSSLGHDWQDATCEASATCSRCGIAEGSSLGHDWQDATCEAPATCSRCGETDGKAAGHKLKTLPSKAATFTKSGLTAGKQCTVCGTITVKQKTIYRASTVKLSTKEYVYNGKVKSPKLIIKDSKGNAISSDYYTVTTPKGRKNVGKYTYTIKFKGNYSGTKKLTLTIKPKATSIKELTASKKAFTVKLSKVSTQATGYEVMCATNSKFTKGKKTLKITSYKTTSKKISKLTSKKTYYVRVRTYKTVKVNGTITPIYSDWSEMKKIKVK